jgi:hypothetical protein
MAMGRGARDEVWTVLFGNVGGFVARNVPTFPNSTVSGASRPLPGLLLPGRRIVEPNIWTLRWHRYVSGWAATRPH